MRQMVFNVAYAELMNGGKTVTRRNAEWADLKPGDTLEAIRKPRPSKKNPAPDIIILGTITVRDVRREPLEAITDEECALEGFPGMAPSSFCTMYRRIHGIGDHVKDVECTRIEFEFELAEPGTNG